MKDIKVHITYALAPILDVPSTLVVVILMTGAMIPVTLLNAEQRASPVPLWGAGKASGVYAYKTPYIYTTKIGVSMPS